MQHRPLRAGGAASRRSRPLARGPRRAPPAPPRAPRASVLAAAPPLLGPGGLALRLLQLPSTPEHLLGVRLAGVALSAATAWVLLAAASRAAPPRWGADADAAEAELEAWLQLHGLHDEHATPAAEAATAALATLSPTAATGLHSRFLRPLRFAILAAAAVAAGASAASYFHAPPLVFLALRRALACAAFGVSSWLLVALQQLALARAARAHPPDAPSLAGLKEALRAATAGVGLLAAAQAAGAPAAPLLALGSVGGLSFGLATQVTASNLVSGAAILLSRHLRVGDKVGLPGTGEKGFGAPHLFCAAGSKLDGAGCARLTPFGMEFLCFTPVGFDVLLLSRALRRCSVLTPRRH